MFIKSPSELFSWAFCFYIRIFIVKNLLGDKKDVDLCITNSN